MKNLILTTTAVTALLISACSEAPDVSKVHADTLTLDTHVDIPLTYMTEIDPNTDTELQVDLGKMKKGGLDAAFFIVYTPQGELDRDGYSEARKIATRRFRAIKALTDTYPEHIVLAGTADEVEQINKEGKLVALIGVENAYPLARSCESVQSCDAAIKAWAEQGVRYVGITHFGHNQFGDSSNLNLLRDDGPRHNGLSDQGMMLIDSLNRYGIMVDLSHAGKETMMQAADRSRTPIIASHSGVKAVADTPRNIDDEQLEKIRQVGGVVQIVALGAYVKLPTAEQRAARTALDAEYGDRAGWDQETRDAYMAEREKIAAMAPGATVAGFVDHIDHAVKVAGIDHVGIASDFDGGGGIDGWWDATETENVTAELINRGYSEKDIAKIWGGNILRVMREVEAEAALTGE